MSLLKAAGSPTQSLSTALKSRWHNSIAITKPPFKNIPRAESWFQNVESRYCEPWRYYHTLNHISELFQYYDSYHDKLHNPAVCTWSIWFHDIIYDPKRNDNEEVSAQLWKQFASECLLEDGEVVDKVYQYILATKSHKASSNNDETPDTDLLYFLDFDIAVLAKPQEEYKEYASNIRKEYIHYPEKDYKQGRSQVLSKLMQSGLFATQEFRTLYEGKAKENMQQEINSLLDNNNNNKDEVD